MGFVTLIKCSSKLITTELKTEKSLGSPLSLELAKHSKDLK
jgi:hypothetical protein